MPADQGGNSAGFALCKDSHIRIISLSKMRYEHTLFFLLDLPIMQLRCRNDADGYGHTDYDAAAEAYACHL